MAIAILATVSSPFAEEPALKVPAAYLDAMETGDLEGAGRLFAAESSVFESGGQESNWAHYREHHLGPEIAAIESFVVLRGTPEVEYSGDGTMRSSPGRSSTRSRSTTSGTSRVTGR